MSTTLRQILRPALGRATDKRVTQDYLTARNLPGNPFVAGTDVDLVDEINNALAYVQAQIGSTVPVSGTRAARVALDTSSFTTIFDYFETDTHATITFFPGTGWRDKFGGNPDAAAPPPDTGAY